MTTIVVFAAQRDGVGGGMENPEREEARTDRPRDHLAE
jgi:hypothetical protein